MLDVAQAYHRVSAEQDPSLVAYVDSTLRKLQIPSLQSLHRSFVEDKGMLLVVSSAKTLETLLQSGHCGSNDWILVEESGVESVRAWRFDSFIGVSAQFCTKLLLQIRGSIGVLRFSADLGAPEVARFQGEGRFGRCSLLMAPADYLSK